MPRTEETTQSTRGRADYEERLEARRESYAEKSAAANQRADQLSESARARLPSCGSPVLIGHHSERRHRNAHARADNEIRASIRESEKAKHYAARAKSAGTAGISHDDPEAYRKLEAKIAGLEANQETMKAANKIIRSKQYTEETKIKYLVALNFSEAHARDLMKPNPHRGGRNGFPSYAITNNGAGIRTAKKRLAEMKEADALTAEATETTGTLPEGIEWRAFTDTDENRVCLELDARPAPEISKTIKGYGFNWSRRFARWQAKATAHGHARHRHLVSTLQGLGVAV